MERRNALCASLVAIAFLGGCGAKPSIRPWHGNEQLFGVPGNAQRWVNVLGNASAPDGVASLAYSLNGGPEQSLSIGPDKRRLISEGDFNIEIDSADLVDGSNEVRIRATDRSGETASERVHLEYVAGGVWPLPYLIDWSTVDDIQEVAQVVDGLWTWDASGVRPHSEHIGYDRLLAIGDRTWTDYEVTVPITVHALDDSALGSPISIGPAVGVIVRWQGHTETPVQCTQPHCGWVPHGAMNWYWFGAKSLGVLLEPGRGSVRTSAIQLNVGRTYWFRCRIDTTDAGTVYRLKVWEDGMQHEPAAWSLETQPLPAALDSGSFLLVAHHVDVTFGNVSVRPSRPAAGDLAD